MNKRESIIDIFKDKHMRLTLIPLVFSAIFMIGGTFAWFNFFSDVNNTMTGHVVGWNISFEGDETIDSEYTITIDKIFPGMDNFSSPIVITNSGEAKAEISYRVKSIEVFGVSTSIGDTVNDVVLDDAKFIQYIEDTYPFKFSYSIDNPVIDSGESANFTAGMTWAYETYKLVASDATYEENREYYTYDEENDTFALAPVNEENFSEMIEGLYQINDIEDTYWGESSITYSDEHPDEPSVKLVIEISASQALE